MNTSSSLLSPKEVHTIVAQCVGTANVEVLDVTETTLDNESGGFMSDYVIFKIEVRLSDGTNKTYQFFSKTLPSSIQHREYVKEVQCYDKEIGYYQNLLPILLKHQNNEASHDDSRVKGRWGPHCFLTRGDMVVMEDLSVLGYKVCNYRELLDWQHCAATLKKLASFHAASVIFEEKESEQRGQETRIGDLHPECFSSVIDRSMPGQENVGWFPCGVRAMIDLVPHLTKYQHDKGLQKTIQENLSSALKQLSLLSRSEKFRNVVCHGDLWASNILFRYGHDKRPESVRLIDYQILRYAPPATDIVVFLFTTTNREFRKRHVNNLLKVYYEEFSWELQNNGLSANELLSFEELQRSFEFYLGAGRATAAMYYEMILMDTETKQSLFASAEKYARFFSINRSAEVLECFRKDEIYRCRVQESIDEVIETDILHEK
ncbi:hypothetical protein R5R35_013587 [Gryllus longicercus]|uniref:CHK kinase-like domain-containing protein n=1 Tax=Gryllus longicercus TaxID=2509291 RepID=A0AAN9VB15_9ORTH